jgi:purine nucleoside phosphorylase
MHSMLDGIENLTFLFCISGSLHTMLEENPLQQGEIGIIGGSGLYSMPGLTEVREMSLDTPFGKPSDAYVLGTLSGRKVAFLSRHGRGHLLMPTELPYRASHRDRKYHG